MEVKKNRKFMLFIPWCFFVFVKILNYIGDGCCISNSVAQLIFILFSLFTLLNKEYSLEFSVVSKRPIKLLTVFSLFILITSFFSINFEFALSNSISFCCYILVVFLTVEQFNKYKILNEMIYLTYITIGIIISYQTFLYRSWFKSIDILSAFFRVGDYTRYTMGFSVNMLGNICMMQGILFIYLLKKRFLAQNHAKIVTSSIIFIINIFVLLITSSRTSILGLLIFIVLQGYSFIIKKIKLKKLEYALFFSCVLICLILLFLFVGIENFFVYAGRQSQEYLKELNNLKKIFIGIGYVGSGHFGNGSINLSDSYWMDNYYIYILVTTGIIGFLLICFTLISMFKFFVNKNLSIEFSILVVLVIAGLFETCVFYQHFISSYIFGIILLSGYYSRSDKKTIEIADNITIG